MLIIFLKLLNKEYLSLFIIKRVFNPFFILFSLFFSLFFLYFELKIKYTQSKYLYISIHICILIYFFMPFVRT